jgi:hypothetical protein
MEEPQETESMYRFSNWLDPKDSLLIEVKKKVESTCKPIPKTAGHRYQEGLANALSVALSNKNKGCGENVSEARKQTGTHKCYKVGSSGAGSGSGDVSIGNKTGEIKIECKKGHAQGGDMTFSWNGGTSASPTSWKFHGIAGKMCPTDKQKASLQTALCTSITKMLIGPLGTALANRAVAINAWQVKTYGTNLAGKPEYPLVTMKEAWLVASDKFPMMGTHANADGESASYFNMLGNTEYWSSLQDILVKKGDHFIQFKDQGLFRVADDPFGVGKTLGIPYLTDSVEAGTGGGRVEVRVRPSGFSKTGGRLVPKSGGKMERESAKAKTAVEANRALILKSKTMPKSGMHIHVPQLGKKAKSIDIYTYPVPGKPNLSVKMAGASSTQYYNYIASEKAEEGEYIGTIEFTMKPIKVSADEWYVKGNFKHRTSKVALSAILRIDDDVTSTLKKPGFSLDNPADVVKFIDSLPKCV